MALSRHAIESDYEIDFDGVSILHSEKVKLKCEILVVINTKQCENKLNFKTPSISLQCTISYYRISSFDSMISSFNVSFFDWLPGFVCLFTPNISVLIYRQHCFFGTRNFLHPPLVIWCS